MALPTSNRSIRFLHVPKTAGTSTNVILDRFYPPSCIFGFKHTDSLSEGLHRFRSLDQESRNRIRLFRGHAPLVTGDADVDGARTFTLLRDPAQRVASFCCAVKDGKVGKLSQLFPSDNFDLDAFLGSGHPELENLQSKMLLGEDAYQALKQSFSKDALREGLSAAFARIEFVGLQEHYEDSMLLATLIFGWPPVWPGKRLNTRRERQPLNFGEEHLRQIRNLNTMDMEAYRMAGEIYARTRLQYGSKLAWLRLRLRARNSLDSALARFLPPKPAATS